ncbi:MAG: beta-glucosidase [Acidimicrobiales bacterium]
MVATLAGAVVLVAAQPAIGPTAGAGRPGRRPVVDRLDATGVPAAGGGHRARGLAPRGPFAAGGAFASAARSAESGEMATSASLDPPSSASVKPSCPWLDSSLPVATRVRELLSAMTPQQEATMMHLVAFNAVNPYEGYSPAIPRLCVPEINEQDGAAGVASGYSDLPDVSGAFAGATQLPAPITDAAAFDPSLARSYGGVIGSQAAAKGVDMALSPTVNIDRSPLWGRSYESLGEDPYLTASLGTPLVKGIQAQRVVSVVKHFAAYNQELGRGTLSDNVVVSDRAMREIYLPAFAAVVAQARPGSIMCSYNLINGTPACQDLGLLVGILHDEWGFAGFVRSDCGSIFAQAPAFAAGVSQLKCSELYAPPQVAEAVASGALARATLDGLVRPLLDVLFTYNLIADPHRPDHGAPVDTAAGNAVSLRTDAEGAVLLKNAPVSRTEGPLLPLSLRSVRSVALIGAHDATPMPAGFGAMHVRPTQPVSNRSALEAALGARLHFDDGSNLADAAAVARASEVAVVVVSDVEHEGRDRSSLALPDDQDALVAAVEAANPRTVVVLETGAAVLMPWLGSTPALLETWYPGQTAGTSLVQLLSGQVNPSGRLPVTFPASAAVPAPAPDTQGGGGTVYQEGVDVGYRWYQTHGVAPAFSFGYGLSYTTFRFSRISARPARGGAVTVQATVTNTGRSAGSDVLQCYLGDPAATGEPPRQLRGYRRVSLAPGASQVVSLTLTPGDMAWWDTAARSWQVSAGTYQLWVGDGSDLANLPLHTSFAAAATNLGPVSGPAPPAS